MKIERIQLSDIDENVYLEAYIADSVQGVKRKPILIIPGGGYYNVCAEREGEPIALAFLPYGYNAFVLNYTVGRKKSFPCQLVEAAKAIKHIKDNADKYTIDADRLFVAGFSAGGHLAASTGVLWKNEEIYKQIDMPYGYNKPFGVMLLYPVISSEYEHHFNSFQNLFCTDEPTKEQLAKASIEKNVDADSAPAFIMHTADDAVVDVNNSLDCARAYAAAGVPFELHIYPHGPHGIALANELTANGIPGYINEDVARWVSLAARWANNLSKNNGK